MQMIPSCVAFMAVGCEFADEDSCLQMDLFDAVIPEKLDSYHRQRSYRSKG